MTTWYVRTTGSNTNNGTTAATAFQTIAKALSSVVAGDTVYIGGGVYRETDSATVTGSSGNVITLIGDVDGSQTGDVGEVRWTAYTTNDKTAPSATATLTISALAFYTFQTITFVSGSGNVLNLANSHDLTFTDCLFSGFSPSGTADLIVGNNTTLNQAMNWTFNRCRFMFQEGSAHYVFNVTTNGYSGGSDLDINFVCTNCFFCGAGTAGVFNLTNGNSYATSKTGGCMVTNCTGFIGNATFMATSQYWSTTTPAHLYNNLIVGSQLANANTTGQIVEDYNNYLCYTGNTNVTTGTHSKNSAASYALLLQCGQENVVGSLQRPFSTPTYDSPQLGFGGNSPPSVDIWNRTRPSGAATFWANNNTAVGCYERHDYGTKDTATYQTGPTSYAMYGTGDQMLEIPVTSGHSTTISIYVQWDTNYGAGTLPQVALLTNGEVGVSAQTVTATGSSGTFNQITLSSFTPTATGFVYIYLISNANANGKVNWDTLNVT